MPKLTLTLAEAPTDVLVYLAGLDDPTSLDDIAIMAGGYAQPDQAVRRDAARRALRLLMDLGYVRAVQDNGTKFEATREGYRAVVQADALGEGGPS